MKKLLLAILLLLFSAQLVSATVVTDNFNRANGNLDGGNWTADPCCFFVEVVTNAIQINAGDPSLGPIDSYSFYSGSSFGATQFAEVTLSNFSKVASQEVNASVLLRWSSSLTGYLFRANWDGGANHAEIYACNGSGCSNIAINSTSWTSGDVMRATVSGTTLTMYQNNVQVLTVTDSSYSTGAPGVGVLLFGTGMSYNQVIMDNFRGGDGDGTTSPAVVRHKAIVIQ